MNYIFVLFVFGYSCSCKFLQADFHNKQQSPLNITSPFFNGNNYLSYLFSSYIYESEIDISLFNTKYYYMQEIMKIHTGNLNLKKNASVYNIGIVCSSCYKNIDYFIKTFHKYFDEERINLRVFDDSKTEFYDSIKFKKLTLKHSMIEDKYNFIESQTKELIKKKFLMAPNSFFLHFDAYLELLQKYGDLIGSDVPIKFYTVHNGYFLDFFFLPPTDMKNYLYDREFMSIEFEEATIKIYQNSFSFFKEIKQMNDLVFLSFNSILQHKIYHQNFSDHQISLIHQFDQIDISIQNFVKIMHKSSALLYEASNFPFDNKYLEYKIFNSSQLYNAFHFQHINKYFSSSAAKNAILTTGVNFRKYEKKALIFFSTLKKYITPNTDIILFTDDEDLEYVNKYLVDFDVFVLPFWSYLKLKKHSLYNQTDHIYQHSYRFVVYYEFLKNKFYSNIFFCDLTDTIFQGNPFSHAVLEKNYFLYMNDLKDEIGTMSYKTSISIMKQSINYTYEYRNEIAFSKVLGVLGYKIVLEKSKFCLGTVLADYSSALLLSQLIIEGQENVGIIVFDNMVYNYIANKWGSVFGFEKIPNGMHYLFLQDKCEKINIDQFKKLKKSNYDAFVIHNYDHLLEESNSEVCIEIFTNYLKEANLLSLISDIRINKE